MKKLTIGMPAFGNHDELWFTLQALRMYQDLDNTELLVVDNEGSPKIKKVAANCRATYEKFTEKRGTGPSRNKIFEKATGDFVLVMDSHVMLWPDAVARLKWWAEDNWNDARNLIHGPLVMSNLENFYTHYIPKWRSEMWGIWPDALAEQDLPKTQQEIGMMGCGVFGCRRDSWLGFHKDCIGFGGVEGVIHEKYRKHGRKVLCLPFLKWVHFFGSRHAFPVKREEKVRNFLLGFKEVGLDPKPLYDHFGKEYVGKLANS
jgi:glycosyltransferase involved in cell wall biosynthesis